MKILKTTTARVVFIYLLAAGLWGLLGNSSQGHEASGVLSGAVLLVTFAGLLFWVLRRHSADLKQLRQEVETERVRLEAVIQQIPSGIILAEVPSGKLVSSNPSAEEILKVPLQPATGLEKYSQFYKGYSPDGRPYASEEWPLARSILRGEVIQNEEVEIQRGDGSRCTTLISSAPIYDSQRRMIAAVASFFDISSQKRNERLVQQSLQIHQELINTIDGIVWEADADFNFTFVSRQAERLLGYPIEEWLKPGFWAERLHPEDRDWAISFCRECSDKLEPHDFEYRMRAADGRMVWLHDAVTVITKDNQRAGLRGIMVDITPRMKAREELERSLSLLNAALESTEDGILVVDLDGKISKFNHKFVEQWQVPESNLRDRDDAKVLEYVLGQLKDPDAFLARVRKLYDHPDKKSLDVIEFKDGRIFERYSQAQRLENRVVGRVWSFRDVTERYQALEEVRVARERLEEKVVERTQELSQANLFLTSLVENLPNTIFVKDAKELRFVRFNRAGEELFGHSREEMIGKNDYDFFPKEEADFFIIKDREALATGKIVDIPEETVQTRNHGSRVLHTRKIPLNDAKGRPQYLVGISEDITERKRAEADRIRLIQEREARIEAEKSIQLRDEFLSIASHELRTPLTPIRMYLQLVRRHLTSVCPEVPKAELLLQGFENADQQFDRFMKLVENLLDVSRITAGRFTLEREELDLDQVVRGVVGRFEPECEREGCQLNLKLSPDVRGQWDRVRIEQAVTNLLANAVKYGRGAPIEVTLDREGSADSGVARLVVRDQGIGISEENHEKIFSRFERVASPKHFGGLGLGLYIARTIVSAHGGTVAVESSPGEGATFTVRLPLRPPFNPAR